MTAALAAPFATLGIVSDGRAITRVAYLPRHVLAMAPRDRVSARAMRQIERWLDDPHFRFTLPLKAEGTPFRRGVWEAIATIPVGASRTYAEVARLVRSSPRAVGGACGSNPIALIVPCHRVVGSRGGLGGFMGRAGPGASTASRDAGCDEAAAIKRWLLVHEGYRFGR